MRLVALLCVALGLNYVDRQMAYSIFPALKKDLGFTDTQLGLVGSTFLWVYALSMPFAGRLADLFRRDRMVVASLALWSAATLGCGLSNSVWMFLFWRAVMGITESLYFPAAIGMLADAHSGHTRSKALSVHQSAQLAGIVVGGWYGGWMADQFSWRMGFGLAAIFGILYALVLGRTLPVSRVPAAPDAGQRESSFQSIAALFRSPCYSALSFAFFVFCSMLWIFYAWFPTFLFERYSLSMAASGLQATIYVQVSCGVGTLIGGALADHFSKRIPAARFYIAAAGIFLCAPFGYLTFAAESLQAATFFSAGYGAFSGLLVANTFAAAYDVVSVRNFGFASSLVNMLGGIAAAFMVFVAGMVKNTLGFAGLLQWVAVACALSAVLLAVTAYSQFGKDHARATSAGS